jgi:hypothetical protein
MTSAVSHSAEIPRGSDLGPWIEAREVLAHRLQKPSPSSSAVEETEDGEGNMKSQNSSKLFGLRVKSSIKAGGLSSVNHNGGLKVKSSVKAGGLSSVNHNLKVKSAVKAGGLSSVNHNVRVVRGH